MANTEPASPSHDLEIAEKALNRDNVTDTVEDNNIDNIPQAVVNNDAEANDPDEPNFNQHRLNKLSQADSWKNFEATSNNFTVAALEKARL